MKSSNLFRGVAAVLLAVAATTAFAQSDDADEPNNGAGEATTCGKLGFIRAARVLNVADEDWYAFTVPATVGSVTVDVAYDAVAYDTALTLEVQTSAGDLLASGWLASSSGPVRATTGTLGAGDYLVRIRHDGGVALANYALKVYSPQQADDADEPNDSANQATAVGPIGFVRPGRALNVDNEDWYSFTVPAGGVPVTVDVAYDTLAFDASVTLEVRTFAGGLLATGSLASSFGPVRAATAPLGAGAYLVHVRLDAGHAVPNYSLQAYSGLSISAPPVTEVTLGGTIDASIDIAGGIKPYTLGVDEQFVVPPGLVFDGVNGRVTGFPAPAGRYEFMVTCRDAGSPANTASALMTVVVHPSVDVGLHEFTAFALGKQCTRAVPFEGGMGPFAVATSSGGLPHGMSFAPGEPAFAGSPDEVGGVALELTVMDSTGVADSVSTTAVVCAPLGTFELAEGRAASGVFVDAVKGSVLSISVSTAKHQAKRALRVVLLGPDGTTPVAAKVKLGKGKAALSAFTAPLTGRYYLVVAGDSGPATQLVAVGKLALPGRSARRTSVLESQETLEVSFGALDGAVLSFSAKADKSGLEVRVQSVLDPSGAQVSVDTTTKSGAITFTKTLDKSGTWTVVLVGARGGPGKVTYGYALTQPKGAVYSADD